MSTTIDPTEGSYPELHGVTPDHVHSCAGEGCDWKQNHTDPNVPCLWPNPWFCPDCERKNDALQLLDEVAENTGVTLRSDFRSHLASALVAYADGSTQDAGDELARVFMVMR